MKTLLIALVAVFALSGCHSYGGTPQKIACWSGGKLMYKGTSIGAVDSSYNKIEFGDLKTGKDMTITNAQCIFQPR